MKKTGLEGTTVTLGGSVDGKSWEHTMSGETFAGLPDRVAAGEFDDVLRRSVREETRNGPALPSVGRRPTWEELGEAFAAGRDAEARYAALKADLKERQAAFEEEVAELWESVKIAKEYHAGMLLALKGLGLQLKHGAGNGA